MAANIKMRPIGPNIIVKPSEAKEESKTKSGFVVVKNEESSGPIQGEIIRLGDGIRQDDGKIVPFTVKEGDSVMFREYAGTEVEIEGEKYKIITEGDIFCIVEK